MIQLNTLEKPGQYNKKETFSDKKIYHFYTTRARKKKSQIANEKYFAWHSLAKLVAN